jgi:hypothetical protein
MKVLVYVHMSVHFISHKGVHFSCCLVALLCSMNLLMGARSTAEKSVRLPQAVRAAGCIDSGQTAGQGGNERHADRCMECLHRQCVDGPRHS